LVRLIVATVPATATWLARASIIATITVIGMVWIRVRLLMVLAFELG